MRRSLDQTYRAWEEAGFLDLDGRLGKPVVGSGYVLVPGKVEIDGPFLIWNLEPLTVYRSPVDMADILDRFVRLSVGTPKDILQFARNYGVLSLRRIHGGAGVKPRNGKESLFQWRRLSREAGAFLNIAAALSRGLLGATCDWQDINAGFPPRNIREARTEFQWKFGEKLQLAKITFGLGSYVEGRESTWRTEIDYSGCLSSALVFQLLLTIVKANSLYVCSGCGVPYFRKGGRGSKKPNPGDANFCPRCGRIEAVRQADVRRRQKVAEAKRLHSNGKSPSEIAAELHTTSTSVLRWVKKKGK